MELTDEKRTRLEGAGRKPLDETLEEELLLWITERRSAGLRVSRKIIAAKAKNIYTEKDDRSGVEFHSSNGWVQNFLNRHGQSVRRKTTLSQKDRLVDKLVHFVLQVRRLWNQHSYINQNVIAMDETAVWLDMISGKTVDAKGTKTIRMKTTGHEKSKVVFV